MTDPVVVGYNQNKFVIDGNTEAKGLHVYNATTTLSAHDDNDTNYQVPVGKKFIILHMDIIPRDASGGCNVIQTATPDTTTGTKLWGYFVTGSGTNEFNSHVSIDTYLEVDAGNYISIQPIPAGNFSCYGVELNA